MRCPRCGGPVRPPDLMHSDWRCPDHGPIAPLHVPRHVGAGVVDTAARLSRVPLWCPWPLLQGWMVTGVGWAGDERTGAAATVLACSGPAPLGGPADVVLVAEEPGVGLGCWFAGFEGPDPGPVLAAAVSGDVAHAKIIAAGHPTPLWSVPSADDRCVYVGEAKGLWLYAVAFPAAAGYVLAEHVVLHDLTDSRPPELVYGALSPYLVGED
ncbi:DUF6758 family protein [Actinocatenispora rupis]|uniref:DUF6758 family protein n=1 Tax=Actinocatenispora rupis TaxID=519421 RepID=UPI0031E5A810